MKPTRQEIIELAREAGWIIRDDLHYMDHQAMQDALVDRIQRFATILLERFGAGGGEPVAWLNPYGGVVQVRATGHEKEHFTVPLYTHPSPTDLRAEYERGLEDAAKMAEAFHRHGYDYTGILELHEFIRALKGKQ